MTDIDDRIREASLRYRRASAVPRDEIWARLALQRSRWRNRAAAGEPDGMWRRSVPARIAAAAMIFACGGVTGALLAGADADQVSAIAKGPASDPIVAAYLASSDSLIAAFRASDEQSDSRSRLGPRARELVTYTRALEDVTRRSETELRKLLADLDLVLTQIAQYASRGAPDRGELALIEDAINVRRVDAKLHDALGRAAARGSE